MTVRPKRKRRRGTGAQTTPERRETPAPPLTREQWDRLQAEAMNEAVRVAKEDGERQARRAHELGRAHPGERIGAGELVDLLLRERGRDV